MASWHKKRLLEPLAGRLIHLAIISYRRLLNVKMVNDAPWRQLYQDGETVLLCLGTSTFLVSPGLMFSGICIRR